MKPISTRMHGVLDYLTAGTWFMLPRMAGWNERATGIFTAVALGATAYSLLTDYELGVVRTLPMQGHLLINGLTDASFFALAALLQDEPPEVRQALVAFGLFGLTVTLLTQPEPAPA